MGKLTSILFLLIPIASAQFADLNNPISLRNVAISDDGKDVYFAAHRNPDGTADQGSNLYRYQSATGTTTKLTNYRSGSDFYGVTSVAYPGSGTRVAYAMADSEFPQEDQIHIYDTATGRDTLIDTSTEDCQGRCILDLHMTRDGTVFYAAQSKNFPFYTVKADGSGRADMNIFQARVAPTGQRIISDNGKVVFGSNALNGPVLVPTASDVYVMNLDGTNVQQVTRLKFPMNAVHPVISADGTRIAFTLLEAFVINPDGTITVPTKASEIWTVRPDGTDLRRLSSGATNATEPSISADGSFVTYMQENQIKQVSTLLDPLALVAPVTLTSFSTSYPYGHVISGDGKQTAIIVNGAAVYLVPSGPWLVRWTDTSNLTRVYAPRVIYMYSLRSAGLTAKPSVGSLVSLFGWNLGDDELSITPSFPLPTTLGGVELWMNGAPLPLQATTPWQINAHIPQSAPAGDASFIAKGGNRNATSEIRIEVLARDPESLSVDVSRGQAAAVFPGTRTVADQQHPASPGQILELYTVGLGVTTPRVAAGVASPSNPPADADVMPRLRIGDRDAEIVFAGLVPGLAGVYQVNFRVPNGIAPNRDWPGRQTVRWVNADGSLSGSASIFVKE